MSPDVKYPLVHSVQPLSYSIHGKFHKCEFAVILLVCLSPTEAHQSWCLAQYWHKSRAPCILNVWAQQGSCGLNEWGKLENCKSMRLYLKVMSLVPIYKTYSPAEVKVPRRDWDLRGRKLQCQLRIWLLLPVWCWARWITSFSFCDC